MAIPQTKSPLSQRDTGRKVPIAYYWLTLLYASAGFGQAPPQKNWQFGPQLGLYGDALKVNYTLDSLAIQGQENGVRGFYLSLFLERKLSSALQARAELAFLRAPATFGVFHLRPSNSAWGSAGRIVTIPNNIIQLPLLLSLSLPLVSNRVSLGIIGGISSHFQFGKDSPDVHVDNRLIFYQEEADAMNNLDHTRRFYVPYSLFGFRATIGRFSFLARHEANLTRSLLKNLEVGGHSYYIPSRNTYSYLSVGYSMHRLKLKERLQ